MSARKRRKEELLAAARERLKDASDGDADEDGTRRQIMYRGQVVRNSGGATSGAGQSAAEREAQAALAKIKALYHQGLITRAEAEAKRTEILDNLEG